MYWWHIELNAVSLVNLVVVWQYKNIYIYIAYFLITNYKIKKKYKIKLDY